MFSSQEVPYSCLMLFHESPASLTLTDVNIVYLEKKKNMVGLSVPRWLSLALLGMSFSALISIIEWVSYIEQRQQSTETLEIKRFMFKHNVHYSEVERKPGSTFREKEW